MKRRLIVNPAAAGGSAGRRFLAAQKLIEARLGVDCVCTTQPGHARLLAAQAFAQGYAQVFALGGDGTLSEVVDGVMADGARCTVGLLPMGTGGDFRRTLGLPERLDEALAVLASGCAGKVDVGCADFKDSDGKPATRAFINVASVGMGGLVDQLVQSASRSGGRSGKAAYFIASLRALASGECVALKVEYRDDEGWHTEVVETRSVAVCNGSYFGGGMHVAPMAKPNDGWLDLVAMTGSARLPYLTMAPALYKGQHTTWGNVKVLRARELILTPPPRADWPLDIDGEYAGKGALKVTVLPAALTMIIPPQSAQLYSSQ